MGHLTPPSFELAALVTAVATMWTRIPHHNALLSLAHIGMTRAGTGIFHLSAHLCAGCSCAFVRVFVRVFVRAGVQAYGQAQAHRGCGCWMHKLALASVRAGAAHSRMSLRAAESTGVLQSRVTVFKLLLEQRF